MRNRSTNSGRRNSKTIPKKVVPLPFSGRSNQELVQIVAVTVFTTLFLFVLAHMIKNVSDKINDTHVMSSTILKSVATTNTAVGTLIDANEEIISATDKILSKNEEYSKEIKQLSDGVKKLKQNINQRRKAKKVSVDYGDRYPVVSPVINGYRH